MLIAVFLAVLVALTAVLRVRRNFIKVNDKILEVASDDGNLSKVLDITSGDELEVIGNNLNKLLLKTGNTVRGDQSRNRQYRRPNGEYQYSCIRFGDPHLRYQRYGSVHGGIF